MYVNGFVTRYGNPIPMVYHVFPIAVAVVGGMPFVIAVLYIYIIIYIYVCVCACACACVCVFGNAQVKSHARHKNPWGLADANCTKISRENLLCFSRSVGLTLKNLCTLTLSAAPP